MRGDAKLVQRQRARTQGSSRKAQTGRRTPLEVTSVENVSCLDFLSSPETKSPIISMGRTNRHNIASLSKDKTPEVKNKKTKTARKTLQEVGLGRNKTPSDVSSLLDPETLEILEDRTKTSSKTWPEVRPAKETSSCKVSPLSDSKTQENPKRIRKISRKTQLRVTKPEETSGSRVPPLSNGETAETVKEKSGTSLVTQSKDIKVGASGRKEIATLSDNLMVDMKIKKTKSTRKTSLAMTKSEQPAPKEAAGPSEAEIPKKFMKKARRSRKSNGPQENITSEVATSSDSESLELATTKRKRARKALSKEKKFKGTSSNEIATLSDAGTQEIETEETEAGEKTMRASRIDECFEKITLSNIDTLTKRRKKKTLSNSPLKVVKLGKASPRGLAMFSSDEEQEIARGKAYPVIKTLSKVPKPEESSSEKLGSSSDSDFSEIEEKSKMSKKKCPGSIKTKETSPRKVARTTIKANEQPSGAKTLPRLMEARVTLEDLRYGNILSQQQRRQLVPKRRRTSSLMSDRTKKFLKEVAKEETEWMSGWTSSSVESLIMIACQNAEEQTSCRSKLGRKRTKKTQFEDLPKSKTREKLGSEVVKKKPRGRPRKKASVEIPVSLNQDDAPASVVENYSAKDNFTRSEVIDHDDFRPNKENPESINENVVPEARNTKFEKPMGRVGKNSLRVRKPKFVGEKNETKNSPKILPDGKGRVPEMKLSIDRKEKYAGFLPLMPMKVETQSPEKCCVPSKYVIPKRAKSHLANRTTKQANAEDASSLSVSLVDPLSESVISNSLGIANGNEAPREDEFSSYLNGDSRSEDFNGLQPLLAPLDEKNCTLDSIERAIEHDLAAGNRLLDLEDCEGISDEILALSKDTVSLPGLNIDGHPIPKSIDLYQTLPGKFQAADCSKPEVAPPISRLSKTVTAQSVSDKDKRKLPEVVAVDFLPRGMIDVPPRKEKMQRIDEKRRKMEEDRRTIESSATDREKTTKLHFPEKTGKETSSGAQKSQIIQPEVKVCKKKKSDSSNAACPAENFEDLLNNNKNVSGNSKKNCSRSCYSLMPGTSPPLSDISDECKAMSELLSSLDVSTAINTKMDASADENRQIVEPMSIVNVESSDPQTSGKKESPENKKIVKLTKQNLDRFNTMCNGESGSKSLIISPVPSPIADSPKPPNDEKQSEPGPRSRKRKWVSRDHGANPSGKSINGKVSLVRKRWGNGQIKTPQYVESSSTTSQTTRSVDEEEDLREDGNEAIDGPSINVIRESAKTEEAFEEPEARETNVVPMNNNHYFQSSEIAREILEKEDDRADRELIDEPPFAPSSISLTENEDTSGSSSSRSSSSFSSSSDSSSKKSSDRNRGTEENCKSPQSFLDNSKGTEKTSPRLPEDPIIEEPMEAPLATKEIQARMASENMKIRSLGEKPRAKTQKDEARLGIKARLGARRTKIDNKGIESRSERNEAQGFYDGDNFQRTRELESTARLERIPSKIEENTSGDFPDDEEDCISLFTESLCMSRSGSPLLYDQSNPSRLQITREPYARMKSENIDKFVAENDRECDEIFQTPTQVSTITFEKTLVCESNIKQPMMKPMNPPEMKCFTNNKTDIDSYLRSEMENHAQALPRLFRGQCFSWLRYGNCNMKDTCRFWHALKPLFKSLKNWTLNVIGEVLRYAIQNRYGHFIGLVWNEITADLTAMEIKSLYLQLSAARLITVTHIENIVEALRHRGMSLVEILSFLLTTVSPENVENIRFIILGMHKKLEPGKCWDVLEKVLPIVSSPPQIIETIIEEAVQKNSKAHAARVYETAIKRVPYYPRTEVHVELWKKFHDLRTGTRSSNAVFSPLQNQPEVGEIGSGSRFISPESPRSDEISPVGEIPVSFASPNIEANINPSSSAQTTSQTRSPPSPVNASWNLRLIDKLKPPKSLYRDKLWKFHWDLQGLQEGLKHKDYAHVMSILSQYTKHPNRLPHIDGFHSILCKEIMSSTQHTAAIVRFTGSKKILQFERKSNERKTIKI